MAETKKQNIKIESGTDFVMPFVWLDENDEPVDLTGAVIEAQLREYSASSDGFDFICAHNGAEGKIILTMPHEVTSLIPYSTGYYDVFVTLSGAEGNIRSMARYGDVEIQDNVTKPIEGTMLYMIGVDGYDDLPEAGDIARLYFVYEDRKIYRWNGTNYVATAVGNGIRQIEFKEHSSPFTDTFTIIYDDGTTWDYQVTTKGIESIELIGTTGDWVNGSVDNYRIHFNNGDHYDYDVRGGRIYFPIFDVDFETGYLVMTEDVSVITFLINETSGMLSYSY